MRAARCSEAVLFGAARGVDAHNRKTIPRSRPQHGSVAGGPQPTNLLHSNRQEQEAPVRNENKKSHGIRRQAPKP